MAERPGLLTTVAIIAIVLGALGVLSSLGSVASSAMQEQMLSLQQESMPAEQREFTRGVIELTAEYRTPMLIGALLNLVASALLITAGALALGRKTIAARLLLISVVGAAVVDLYNTYFTVVMQNAMMPMMDQMARSAAQDMPPGADASMETIMATAQFAGTLFVGFFLLLKLAYYIVTAIALGRPRVKAWFAGEADT